MNKICTLGLCIINKITSLQRLTLLFVFICINFVAVSFADAAVTSNIGKRDLLLPSVVSVSRVIGCATLSPLPCEQLQVNLPFKLNFNGNMANTIIDNNGVGTGFTLVAPYSGMRLAVDGAPASTDVPGYEASKLLVSGGALQLTTSKGFAYRAENNQINTLGVKIDTRGKLQLDAVLIEPFLGTQFQQGGLWIGLDDKTYIKLVVVGAQVELRKESNDASSNNTDQRITSNLTGLNTKNVRLRLLVDPVAGTVQGLYSTDGTSYLNVGQSYTQPSLTIAGMGITGGTAYAGVFATHRNASAPVTYKFDEFSVTGETTGGDNAPVFSAENYSYSVSDNVGVGAAVGQVLASDPQQGALTYSIVGGNTNGAFAINTSNGAITVAKKLNYHTQATYALRVQASNTAGQLAQANATVTVTAGSTGSTFSSISWGNAAPLPYSVNELQGEMVNNRLFTFGGYYVHPTTGNWTPRDQAFRYDSELNTWTSIASMPPMNGSNYGGVTHAGFATDGTDVYFAGGYTANATGDGQTFGTKEVWKYIVAENRYVRLPDLPKIISSGQLEYLSGKLHHVGGHNQSRTTDLGDHYVLDLGDVSAGWKTLAALPNPRNHSAITAYGGKLYYVGGQQSYDDNSVTQRDLHIYDPNTNSWTKGADMPVPSGATGRAHISSSIFVMGDRILVLGGDINHGTNTNLVSAYSPASDSWSSLTPLPVSIRGGVAAALGGNVYYVGGSNSGTTYKGIPGGVSGNQQVVSSLTLVNADTDQDIQPLTDGATLNLATLPTRNLNIRANTTPEAVGSVVMDLTGTQTKSVTESIAPYALYGDDNKGDYFGWTPAEGSYTLRATPYSASKGTGTPGTALAVNFSITNQVTTPPPPTVLVNAGGSDYVDSQSRTWSGDAGFSGGLTKAKSFDVAGTTDDALYLSYRYASSGGPFSYGVPVGEAGTYTVKLHFLEPYYGAPGGGAGGAGSRVFHVDVEGQRVLSSYDIVAQDGAGRAAVKTFEGVSVSDGVLNVAFSSVVDNAIISAIEVVKSSSSGPDNQSLLLFTPTSATVNVPTGQQKELKVNLNNSDEDPVTVVLTAVEGGGSVPSWLLYGGKTLSTENNVSYNLGVTGNEVLFTIDAAKLAMGKYTATVKATAAGYKSAELVVTLEVASYEEGLRPYVTSVRPADGEISVSISQSVSVDVRYPSGKSIDGNTVNTSTVKLYKVQGTSKTEVTGTAVNSTAAGDAITISASLAYNTTYEFFISDQVKDGNGYKMIPFTSRFSTVTSADDIPTDLADVAFTEQILVDSSFGSDGFTSLVIGPDHRLYAATSGGKIERWDIHTDGTLVNHVTISPFGASRRLLIGLRFDPSATESSLVAWISHSSPEFNDAPDWSGKISRVNLTNPASPDLVDYVINLPRSAKDHATNGLDFGPDGDLYILQGGQTAMGAPDVAWGSRPERLLSAAVLRLSIVKAQQQSLPIDVKTDEGGIYNPHASNAPLTIYATGLRNAYDLVWHTNGQLYVPTNGSAAGGTTPALKSGSIWSNGQVYTGPDIPGMADVRATQSDYLFRVVQGGYYGHPNELRNEYILNGGNPTADKDAAEIVWTENGITYGYPVGTPREPNYKGWAYDFGLNKSPNGVIEYRSDAFGGKLKGKLLVCRFSGGDDIMVLEPGTSNLDIIRATEGNSIPGFRRPFANPLDMIEDVRTGNLYISEYFDGNGDGQPRISLLRVGQPDTPVQTAVNLINAGGSVYTDVQSRTWSADTYFSGGLTSSKSFDVVSTSDDALYLNYRYASSGAPFSYSVPVSEAGTYTVKLHFVEPYFKNNGSRVFSVNIEGNQVLDNFDIYSQVGFGSALIKTIDNVSVSDGALNIIFSSIKDNAIISGVELLKVVTPPPTVLVNAGGSDYVDSQSRTWSGDAGFSGGLTKAKSFDVAGTTDDALYLSYRYASSGGPFSYGVPVGEAGTYTVKLHFLEPYYGAPGGGAGGAGSRVFHVDVEGQRVLSSYDIVAQDGAGRAAVKTFEGVSVSDGVLNVAFSSVVDNAIISAIEVVKSAPANPNDDNVPPVVAMNLTGIQQSGSTYLNEVIVSLVASDAGGAGLASVEYSLDGGAYTTYSLPIKVIAEGAHRIRARATDKNNNQTVADEIQFQVVKAPQNDTYMVLENTDKFPNNDRLTFSLIQTPWRRMNDDGTYTPFNENHNKVRLKINNKGKNPLIISNLSLSNAAGWKIIQLNGADYSGVALPISISSGGSAEAVVEFVALNQANRVKVLNDTLYIASNDDIAPVKKVVLHGLWQKQGEGNSEPYAQEIINAFGFKSKVGFNHDDGTNDGTSVIASSDEVDITFFVRADLSKPVNVVQMAAYHGCCSATETIRWYDKVSKSNVTLFTHNPLDGQSLLPRKNGSSTAIAEASFTPATSSANPNAAFGLRVNNQYTERSRNAEGKLGFRIWKAVDTNGNIIPNAYIIGHDYIGAEFTNYDYQDNIYFISNVKPETGSGDYPILTSAPSAASLGSVVVGSSKSVSVTLTNAGGASNPAVQIKSISVVGANANEFSVTGIAAATLASQATVNANVKFQPQSQGIKNAAILVNFNSSESPLRIPLYGIGDSPGSAITAVKRIKGGSNVSVNIAGNTWEADTPYRQGSVKLDKQVVQGPISSTDDDVLYQTYLSAASDLAETRYSIPIANGSYMVRMHFVENYFSAAGARVFNTTIEDQLMLTNFDIYREVGYRSALVKDFIVNVSDGNLNIKYNPIANRVALAGMEIYKASPTATATSSSSSNFSDGGGQVTTTRSLMVYPNPVAAGASFIVAISNFKANEALKVTMHDLAGRIVTSFTAEADGQGACSREVNVDQHINHGVYFIRVVAPSGVMTTKLVIK